MVAGLLRELIRSVLGGVGSVRGLGVRPMTGCCRWAPPLRPQPAIIVVAGGTPGRRGNTPRLPRAGQRVVRGGPAGAWSCWHCAPGCHQRFRGAGHDAGVFVHADGPGPERGAGAWPGWWTWASSPSSRSAPTPSALLTSDQRRLSGAHLGFFAALPIRGAWWLPASGFLFGLPVLRVRGDYLAIATLGLGEIIRVLVLSDMLKPQLGGAQGIVNIPKPPPVRRRARTQPHACCST